MEPSKQEIEPHGPVSDIGEITPMLRSRCSITGCTGACQSVDIGCEDVHADQESHIREDSRREHIGRLEAVRDIEWLGNVEKAVEFRHRDGRVGVCTIVSASQPAAMPYTMVYVSRLRRLCSAADYYR